MNVTVHVATMYCTCLNLVCHTKRPKFEMQYSHVCGQPAIIIIYYRSSDLEDLEHVLATNLGTIMAWSRTSSSANGCYNDIEEEQLN